MLDEEWESIDREKRESIHISSHIDGELFPVINPDNVHQPDIVFRRLEEKISVSSKQTFIRGNRWDGYAILVHAPHPQFQNAGIASAKDDIRSLLALGDQGGRDEATSAGPREGRGGRENALRSEGETEITSGAIEV